MAKGRKPSRLPRSPLQVAGASFVDQLGKAAVEKLKAKLGLNTETKYVMSTNSVVTQTVPQVFASTLSTAIPQDLTDNGREGASCRVTKHSMRFEIYQDGNNADASTLTRVVVTRWSPTAGGNVSSNVNDILEQAAGGALGAVLSPPTHQPTYHNEIVFDRTFALGAASDPSTPNLATFSFEYGPTDFHLMWLTTDNTGVIANSTGDLLTVMAVTSSATAAAFPTVKMVQMVEYVDN